MRLSLATRIFLGYALVLVTFGAVSLFAVTELHRNQMEIRMLSDGYMVLSQTAAAVEEFQKNQSHDLDQLSNPNVETRRTTIHLARVYFHNLMAEKLDAGIATATRVKDFAPTPSEQQFVADTAHKFEELKGKYLDYEAEAGQVYTLLERAQPDWEVATAKLEALRRTEAHLRTSARLLHGSLETHVIERVREANERERRTGTTIIALSVLAIAVGLLATGIAARSLRPVKTLIDGVSRIRTGDYSAKIGVHGDDEIATLAREFDAMARALQEREAQLKASQAELLQAERLAAVGRISAQVAHEVRNPLSSIGLNIEMLEEQLTHAQFNADGDANEARELMRSITRELDRLTEITEDYLRLARLPSPTLRRENLHALLDQVLGFSSEELRRAHIELKREGDRDLEVMADEGQLRQVIVNLVRNSRDAMSTGGTLTLSTTQRPGAIELRVADTGVGLTADARTHLFEPFFSTKEGGTGLGLSLSRQIIHAHGGRIEADTSVTTGTTFVITLPRPS